MSGAVKVYTLVVMALSYLSAELGRHLIGVTSKATARDIHYGDISCQLNNTGLSVKDLPISCDGANNSLMCESLELDGSPYCEWTYNGLGLDYQILAGPAFIAVYTVVGVFWGFMADRFNRGRMLAVCTLTFGIAVLIMGAVDSYWELLLLRMVLAAGESGVNPLATGILSDIFSQEARSLAMAIFNLGIFGGFGLAFPVGRYVTELNVLNLGWRFCYYAAGILGVVMAIVLWLTLREPKRQAIAEEDVAKPEVTEKVSVWKVIVQPSFIIICLAASLRHMGGLCWVYNSNLFYQHYFPDYDLSWYLFAISFGMGSLGVVTGGLISDRLVGTMGVSSRVAVLAASQLVASPFAFGAIYFNPLWAMVSLCISYFVAEMWFGILFAILVEIVPVSVRSTAMGIFLFVINNLGGNLPVLVEPASKALGYRGALVIFHIGGYISSAFLFFCAIFLLRKSSRKTDEAIAAKENPGFISDDMKSSAKFESHKL